MDTLCTIAGSGARCEIVLPDTRPGSPSDIATLTLRAVSEGPASVSLSPDLVDWSVDGVSVLALSLGALLAVRIRRGTEPRAAH
jgi:hypothetical protein